MIPRSFDPWREIWVIDTEYRQPDGDPIEQAHCLVGYELRSGQVVRLWSDQLGTCPFRLDREALFVCYAAGAEMSFFLKCGWSFPHDLVDLFCEFRWLMSGIPRASQTTDDKKKVPRDSMLDALYTFGIRDGNLGHKERMRGIAIRGAPFTTEERAQLLAYCEDDVRLTAKLFAAMAPRLEPRYAVLRGDYVQELTKITARGIPLDMIAVDKLRANWEAIKVHVAKKGEDMGVFEGTHLRLAKLAEYARRHGIDWPRTPTGRPKKDVDTFRDLARPYPKEIGPLYEIVSTLEHLKQFSFETGSDGRNRTFLNPFGSKTGRNQPRSSRYIFGPARWVRSVIAPPPGHAIAYVDWSAQEIAIAAYLSRDPRMIEAYQGDPYLWLAARTGHAPEGATKQSHPVVRDQFKVVYLAANYRMGRETLANNIQVPMVEAARILSIMRQEFPVFFQWSENGFDHAIVRRELRNVLGWRMAYRAETKSTTIYNFPIQSNGAAMLHVAIMLLGRAGIEVIAPVHDAVMIQAPLGEIDDAVRVTQEIMADASEIVLSGRGRLRTSATITRYPDRFVDGRGIDFFHEIMAMVEGNCHPSAS